MFILFYCFTQCEFWLLSPSCLFLPSVAPPHNNPSSSATTSAVAEGAVLSGMGSGELGYSLWSQISLLTCTNLHIGQTFQTLSSSAAGERLFPPPSGLSYSTWFCVERFSSVPHAHPLRLLTVVRRASSSEQHYVCLSVVLSCKDRTLSVSTKEELLQTYCESLLRPHLFKWTQLCHTFCKCIWILGRYWQRSCFFYSTPS